MPDDPKVISLSDRRVRAKTDAAVAAFCTDLTAAMNAAMTAAADASIVKISAVFAAHRAAVTNPVDPEHDTSSEKVIVLAPRHPPQPS